MRTRAIPLAILLTLSACEPEPPATVVTKPRQRSQVTAAPAEEPATPPAEPSPPRARKRTDQEIDRIMGDAEKPLPPPPPPARAESPPASTGAARVLATWRAFERLPPERKTPSAFADVLAETGPAAAGDADAERLNWAESRRHGARLYFGPGTLTVGDDADVLVLHMSKPECDAAIAAQVTARSERGQRARAFLRELRFEAVACFAAKRSSVTGNMIITDKTYLELASMPR